MTPPKPPRKNASTRSMIPSYCDAEMVTNEDTNASVPAVEENSQSEVQVKPVPRPRTKNLPNVKNIEADNIDSIDSTSSTSNGKSSPVSESLADNKKPPPVRPPPIDLGKLRGLRQPSNANAVENLYMNINSETAEELLNPVRNESSRTGPRPERPPLPSIYYDRFSTMKLKSESSTDEGQESKRWSYSSSGHPSASPAVSEEELSLSDTSDLTALERPTAAPRLGQASLSRSASDGDFPDRQMTGEGIRRRERDSRGGHLLKLEMRPPPPSFTPPPPPSERSMCIYSEVDNRPYLDVLPEDGLSMRSRRSNVSSGRFYPTSFYDSYSQTTDDAEDINGMLRWLKRVLKSDSMAPSLYGLSIDEEIRSFTERAFSMRKALRLYNLLMMKRSETMRDTIAELNAICECLDKTHKMGKKMGIAGGTTGAVGGVTAVLGIALAPVTFGASLIATAVGAGMVASAGGISVQKSKAHKKVVNRLAMEKLVYDYKDKVVDLERCLDFILSAMNELRRHDVARLQRAGAPPHAIKMANLSQSVFRINDGKKAPTAHTGGMTSERLLQDFIRDLDLYFTEKDGLKLKKSSKIRFSGRVCQLAKNLQSELDHLNRMWEMFG